MTYFIFICLFFFAVMASANLKNSNKTFCDEFLDNSFDQVDATEKFISYLHILLEQKIFDEENYEEMLKALAQGKFVNPISNAQARVDYAKTLHRQKLQYYLDAAPLEPNKIIAAGHEFLQNRRMVESNRVLANSKTQLVYIPMKFHLVPAGQVAAEVATDYGHEQKTIMINALEVMSTKVTQWMWANEMGNNQSVFAQGKESILLTIKGNNVEMQPDHPVDSITIWSAMAFANRISEKAGLKPAYDMSRITEWRSGTSAEAGNLAPLNPDEGKKLVINSLDGKIENAEGYRLGTTFEREYLMRNLGLLSAAEYPLGIKKEELSDYAWFKENSEGRTHSVGSTAKAFKINGQLFYDLIGNVWEWCDGPYSQIAYKKGGAFNEGDEYLLAGKKSFHFYSDEPKKTLRSRALTGIETDATGNGLRLFRTVKNK